MNLQHNQTKILYTVDLCNDVFKKNYNPPKQTKEIKIGMNDFIKPNQTKRKQNNRKQMKKIPLSPRKETAKREKR